MNGRLIGAAVAAALLAPAAVGPAATVAQQPNAVAQQPNAVAQQPNLDARAWAVVDARTGDVLASHAASRHLPVASTTKLMTAYVTLHELPLKRVVRARPYAASYGESLLRLRRGQRISVRDLLYGLVLRSGNDAAYDLARAAAGSEARFVRQMNRWAAALGLADTHYANPIGLDQRGNYSSARDLTTLGRRLLDIPAFAKIAASRSAVLRSLHPPRRIVTLNALLLQAPWANGIKTGHTFGAAYVLVGAGRRKGVQLVSAVLGAPTDADRDLETLRLLSYGFSRYRERVPIRAGADLAEPSIRFSGGALPLRAARPVTVGVRRDQRLSVSVRAPHEVEGPIARNAVLGRATVLIDGRRAASVPLRAARKIPAASAFDRTRSLIGDHPVPITLALFVILIGAALLWRFLRRGAGGQDEMVSREKRQAMSRRKRGVAK